MHVLSVALLTLLLFVQTGGAHTASCVDPSGRYHCTPDGTRAVCPPGHRCEGGVAAPCSPPSSCPVPGGGLNGADPLVVDVLVYAANPGGIGAAIAAAAGYGANAGRSHSVLVMEPLTMIGGMGAAGGWLRAVVVMLPSARAWGNARVHVCVANARWAPSVACRNGPPCLEQAAWVFRTRAVATLAARGYARCVGRRAGMGVVPRVLGLATRAVWQVSAAARRKPRRRKSHNGS
jgi:hypothetical protein